MVSADPVAVVPYDEAWPSLFEEERACIVRAIGLWVEEIEHVREGTSSSWLPSNPSGS